jgi:hypothetical protein
MVSGEPEPLIRVQLARLKNPMRASVDGTSLPESIPDYFYSILVSKARNTEI